MNITDIGYFLAIVEHKSLQRASAAVGLSQPALTKCVHRLELSLGSRLFERGASGMVPTRAALTFLDYARRLDADYNGAMKVLGDLAAGEAAVIRVGTTPTWEYLVNRAIAAFLPVRPAARFCLSILFTDKLLDALHKGDVDMALVTASVTDPALDSVLLSNEVMVPVARRNHPLHQLNRALTLADFSEAAWTLPRRGVRSRDILDAAFQAGRLAPPRAQIESDGGTAVGTFSLLSRSDLIGLCLGSQAEAAAGAGLLPFELEALRLPTCPVLVTRREAVTPPVVKAFIQAVAALAAATTPATTATNA